MDEKTKEIVRILRDRLKRADKRATRYEKGLDISRLNPAPQDYWYGYMSGLYFAIDLLTEEI